MLMDIFVYKNHSGNNVVDKNILQVEQFTSVRLKEKTSKESPVILISGVSDIGDTAEWNYLRIPKWQRYYYITDIVAGTGRIIELHCSIDVLMTFKDDIKASSQLISRQERLVNKYIMDGRLPVHSDSDFDVIKLSTGFIRRESGFYVLTTGGD